VRKAITEVTASVEKNSRKAAKATQVLVDQANLVAAKGKSAGKGKKNKNNKKSKK
jgi:hypothetical protein